MARKFIHRNESFVCLVCSHNVTPLKGSCRNHCPLCLSSRHVDVNPGDRLNSCKSIMRPVQVIMKGDSQILVHECIDCGHLQRNKVANDDNLEKILEVIRSNPLFVDGKH